MAVITENITKSFSGGGEVTRVLNGISLRIPAGKLTMLVGPSGCGKTTLLSIITGILTPNSGKVFINGTEITALKGDRKVKFRRTELGFIFQQYNLLPALTAAENASVPLAAAGMHLESAVVEAKKILKTIGMEAHVDKFPAELSGGQQQRVSIARALVHNPKLLVCDEPTAALDANNGHKIMEILRTVALDKQRAVIVVTHDNRIFEFADTIIYMGDGRIEKIKEIKG